MKSGQLLNKPGEEGRAPGEDTGVRACEIHLSHSSGSTGGVLLTPPALWSWSKLTFQPLTLIEQLLYAGLWEYKYEYDLI